MDDKLKAALPFLAGDLEWVIKTPFILKDTPQPDLASLAETDRLLEKIRQNPMPLALYLQDIKRHTLGTYFEFLVFFWLTHLPSVSILSKNLQIQSEKQTVGELDLIFSFDGQIYHWELAVKFYASIGDAKEEANWFGPLKKDTLKRKLDHLRNHQLPLANTVAAKQSLIPMEATELISYPFVKGMLFSPHHSAEFIHPVSVSHTCQKGQWIEISDLKNLPKFRDVSFSHRAKPRWFSQIEQREWIHPTRTFSLVEAAENSLSQSDIPVLYAYRPPHNPNTNAYASLFIMPDGWRQKSD
ncbi:DUF1853 family protein [Sneathiella aquimaris]|uniref:DUF1853 family protein n=1 Tax=Sneathiella aquimaris TaxID=2599305 RepID=UPI00146CF894|nr:DUF1853 family protein [Sneathiella aquimaris]